jgi:hypothetical protein
MGIFRLSKTEVGFATELPSQPGPLIKLPERPERNKTIEILLDKLNDHKRDEHGIALGYRQRLDDFEKGKKDLIILRGIIDIKIKIAIIEKLLKDGEVDSKFGDELFRKLKKDYEELDQLDEEDNVFGYYFDEAVRVISGYLGDQSVKLVHRSV